MYYDNYKPNKRFMLRPNATQIIELNCVTAIFKEYMYLKRHVYTVWWYPEQVFGVLHFVQCSSYNTQIAFPHPMFQCWCDLCRHITGYVFNTNAVEYAYYDRYHLIPRKLFQIETMQRLKVEVWKKMHKQWRQKQRKAKRWVGNKKRRRNSE